MYKKIDKILEIWHKHFEDEDKQYSEFESSDIEYFVGCLLYNHFSFEKAVVTMKTIDLSYDFLESCDEEYDEIMAIVKTIEVEDEKRKIEFLLGYLANARSKYNDDENYLLNRLQMHLDGIIQRFENDEDAKIVSFEAPPAPKAKNPNPLMR